jgi:peptidoglycan biosynthesis protein MviN/MurJ (putative lipid II flippase)
VLGSYFFSQARLGVTSIIAITSLVATVAFDLLLIPSFGINGAAAASSIAYGTSFVMALFYYGRISGNDPWACVLPRTADISLYVGLLKRLRQGAGTGPIDSTAVPPT